MQRLAILLVATAAAVWSVLFALPAHADSEYIRHLDVTYDVQADGTVDVRWEAQWHFAERGKRGIILGFASRESWENDRSQDVVYDLRDFRVSSPTGAPAMFEQRVEGSGSDEAVRLQIGNPNKKLNEKDHTYVIEYTMAGALRTFDGAPQLFWDVNSPNLPEVRSFSAQVTAPGGVARARCLRGSSECTSTVDNDGVATFSHGGGDGVTSVVAEFRPGMVANAEPVLVPRRLVSDELRELTSTTTVQPDGSADVEQTLTYEFPTDDDRQRVRIGVITRAPWSEDLDQTLRYSDIRVVDEEGTPLETTLVDSRDGGRSSTVGTLQFQGADDGETPPTRRTFTVSYTIDGAVGVEGDTARLRVPLNVDYGSDLERGEATWVLPGAAGEPACLSVRSYGRGLPTDCRLEASVSGPTVTAGTEALRRTSHRELIDVPFPASSLTSWTELEPSRDGSYNDRVALGNTIGVGSGLGLIGAAVGVARLGRRRDERFADTPAGLIGDVTNVRAAKSGDIVPVNFAPPRIKLYQAGLILDRGFKPTHLGATLVSLAVRDLVRLSSKPIRVQRLGSPSGASGVEHNILQQATEEFEELPTDNARSMRSQLRKWSDDEMDSSGWFHPVRKGRGLTVLAVAALPAIAFIAYVFIVGNPLPNGGGRIAVGLVVGGFIAAIVGMMALPKRGRTASGTALHDQIEGLRTYIKTAEQHQLNFEADRDIFRRLLPWAVLFDLTDRWTEVCKKWEAEGVIDPVDTSFWAGGSSFNDFGREINSFSSEVSSKSAPPSSSGGSGGSSGFSGGSSGGGGGGGTSGSSW